MSIQFKNHIGRFINISSDNFSEILSFFKTLQVKKKKDLLVEGQVCKYNYFIVKGCLRMFFVNIHTSDAPKLAETNQRIFLFANWKETELFDDEEQAVLAVTEEITLIHQHGLKDETYQQALKVFDENYLAQVIMAAITINAWNRIGMSTRMPIGR